MPKLCSQSAWTVLMRPIGRPGRKQRTDTAVVASECDTDDTSRDGSGGSGSSGGGDTSTSTVGSRLRQRLRLSGHGGSVTSYFRISTLHPPHTRPPLVQWRRTRHGMPITFFKVKEWRPAGAGHAERIRHIAYHMEHYVRRMPTRARGTRRVQRCCFVMDMQGFKATMLPNVQEAVGVLRNHYPGRLGAACFINVPPYFHPLWRIISPWLDEEIMSKTFFLPSSIKDVEGAIAWVDQKKLPDPSIPEIG